MAHKFLEVVGLLANLDDVLEELDRPGSPDTALGALPPEQRRQAKVLHAVLAQCCSGKAAALIKTSPSATASRRGGCSPRSIGL